MFPVFSFENFSFGFWSLHFISFLLFSVISSENSSIYWLVGVIGASTIFINFFSFCLNISVKIGFIFSTVMRTFPSLPGSVASFTLAETNWERDADRAWKTSEEHPIFRSHIFCLIKKKTTLDLQYFSRIGKQWSDIIP